MLNLCLSSPSRRWDLFGIWDINQDALQFQFLANCARKTKQFLLSNSDISKWYVYIHSRQSSLDSGMEGLIIISHGCKSSVATCPKSMSDSTGKPTWDHSQVPPPRTQSFKPEHFPVGWNSSQKIKLSAIAFPDFNLICYRLEPKTRKFDLQLKRCWEV